MIAINKTARSITLPSGVTLVPTEPKEVPDDEVELLKKHPIIKLYLNAGLMEFTSGSLSQGQSAKDSIADPAIENQQPNAGENSRLPVFDKAQLEEIPTMGTKGGAAVLANQPEDDYADIDAMAEAHKAVTTIDWAKVRAYLNK